MPVKKYGNGPECYEAGCEKSEPINLCAGAYVSARDGSYVYAVKKNGLQQESIAYPPTASKLRLRVLATKCVLPTHYISENRSFSGYRAAAAYRGKH